MAHILALDQGTTSSRAIVFDEAGSVRAVAQREFRQIFPKPGWVEHDPAEIWETQLATAREALAQAGLTASDVSGIGITNQRETVVLWDRRTGRPIHNAIVWQDRRTAEDCDRLRHSGHLPSFRRKTGLMLDPYFSGTKIAWLLRNVPEARSLAAEGHLAFGTVDSWLIWNLTGGALNGLHATDVTNASRTLLFNIHDERWDDELLDALEVPASILPEVRSSSEVYRETAPGLLGGPIPIAGVAGDQQAALFGQACLRTGMAKCTYGTGCFLLMNTGRTAIRSTHELLTSPAWRLRGHTDFCLEGSVFVGGATVQWLRDGLGIIQTSPESEALAASVPDSGGIVLVPAFTGLGAPHWDPYARGALLGITRGTTAAHLARAALEAIAHQVADVVSAMEADSGVAVSEMRVDGGAVANDLLMQIQADLARIPVIRPKVTETTALGAAYLAGLATGVWAEPADIAEHWQVDRVFEPGPDHDRTAKLRARWKKGVERAKDWEEG